MPDASQVVLAYETPVTVWARYSVNGIQPDDGFKDTIYFKETFTPVFTGITYPTTVTGFFDITAYNTSTYPVPGGAQPFFQSRVSYSYTAGFQSGVFKEDPPIFTFNTKIINGVNTTNNGGVMAPPANELIYNSRSDFSFGPYPALLSNNSIIIRTQYHLGANAPTIPYVNHRNGANNLIGIKLDWRLIQGGYFGVRNARGKIRSVGRAGQREYFHYLNGRWLAGSSGGANFPFPGGEYLTQWRLIRNNDSSAVVSYKRLVSGAYESQRTNNLSPLVTNWGGVETIFTDPNLRYYDLLRLRSGELCAVGAGDLSGKAYFKLRGETGWPPDASMVECVVFTGQAVSGVYLEELDDGTIRVYARNTGTGATARESKDGGATWANTTF